MIDNEAKKENTRLKIRAVKFRIANSITQEDKKRIIIEVNNLIELYGKHYWLMHQGKIYSYEESKEIAPCGNPVFVISERHRYWLENFLIREAELLHQRQQQRH